MINEAEDKHNKYKEKSTNQKKIQERFPTFDDYRFKFKQRRKILKYFKKIDLEDLEREITKITDDFELKIENPDEV